MSMMEWSKKPHGVDEHRWYRQMENGIRLTVISADPQDAKCDGCNQKRVVYHSQIYPERTILSRCKDCILSFAGGMEKIWVRSEEPLRKKWSRDGKDPLRAERMRRQIQQRKSLDNQSQQGKERV